MHSLKKTILLFEKKIRHRTTGTIFVIHFLSMVTTFLLILFLLSDYYVLMEQKNKKATDAIFIKKTILPEIEVVAKSFIVFDIQKNKVLLEKNNNEILPLASLTKIKTALLFAENNPLTTKIIIPDLGKNHIYDFTLKKGDLWGSDELIKFMLTISSNDAAEILAATNKFGRDGFIQKMNETNPTSSSLFFTSPSGLDEKDKIGGQGKVKDVALLIATFYKKYPSLFETTTQSKIRVTIGKKTYGGIPNTNQNVETYRSISGSKTGYTEKAGGNLAILYDTGFGSPTVIVILGSTKEGRFTDMQKILSYIDRYHNELYQDEK